MSDESAPSWRPLIYVDANIFIDAIVGVSPLRPPAQRLIHELAERRDIAVTSELSLAEVLVRVEAQNSFRRKRAYLDLIAWSGVVSLIPVTRDLLISTAKLRATHPTKLRLADAIHLETAIRSRCRVFASSDKGIRPPVGMHRMQPDVDGVDAILKALQ